MERPKSGFLATVFSAFLRPLIGLLDRRAAPVYSGDIALAGLDKAVKVLWERHAIPHVYAENERDLFFAQGYLHAQERLWQMEMNRRFLSGRMAEMFGDFDLPWRDLSSAFRDRRSSDFDYFVRLLGIRAAALDSLALLSEENERLLSAYSDGVNRYIERCAGKLPWEFRLLRHEPEPWRPIDTLTIGKGFAFLLSTALYSRLNFMAVAEKLAEEPEKLHDLFPGYPSDAVTTVRSVWDGVQKLWQFTSGVLAASEWHPAGSGSNGWALAPRRSTSGSAILCNDPHLRLSLPSVWYLIHLRAEKSPASADGYEVWGASIPGIPCVQIGHNRFIAWGITAALCDDVEIYREKPHRIDPELYLVGNRWQPLESRRERIAVRGGRPLEKIVRASRHGPVISDFTALDSKEILTARWVAQEPSREFQSLYNLNCARDWRQFEDALRFHATPSLNFVYADREGNIGYALAGKIPRRVTAPSLLPSNGWDERNDWTGFIEFDELPRLYNPPEGVVANANNRIADAAYPYYLSHLFEPPHRLRRIEQLLGQRERHSPEHAAALQLDHLSLHATDLIAALRGELEAMTGEDKIVTTAAARLLAWDGRCAVASVEAAIFHLMHQRLLRDLLIPVLGENAFHAYIEILNQCIVPTDRIFADPASPWFARRSRNELVKLALVGACSELQTRFGADMERWRWGEVHQLFQHHGLARIDVFKSLVGIGPLPTPGDGMTVGVGFYRHSNPYAQTVGASLRFAIEAGPSLRSGFVLSSGQSGHPTSIHYRDQTDLWLGGRRIDISRPALDADCLHLHPLTAIASGRTAG
jgi:penicillin amidase